MQRVGDLDISQDLGFQHKEWVAQKIGFALIALIVIGALLGFFGAGPLSLTTIEDDSGLMTVTYERFGRRGATSDLQVEVAGSAASQGEIELRVATEYLDHLQIDAIVPTPDKVTAAGDYYVYTFLAEPTSDPFRATFSYTISAMGAKTGSVALADNPPVDLDHFFTP